MNFPGKLLKVTIPVQTPVSSKPEKEEKEEEKDGFSTPKGAEFRIPPQLECPPAPGRGIQRKTIHKRRKKSSGRRITSVNVKDLDTIFAKTHVDVVADDS